MNNPFAMIGLLNRLKQGHPKAALFVRNEILTGLPEGTVIEVTVTKPGEGKKMTNLKLTMDDLEALNSIKSMAGEQ